MLATAIRQRQISNNARVVRVLAAASWAGCHAVTSWFLESVISYPIGTVGSNPVIAAVYS